MTDDASIESAFNEVFKYGHIDVLINNAGASFDQELIAGKLSIREAWNKAWDVNVAGTYMMTHTFMPLLLKSDEPRLLFIASGTSSLTETASDQMAFNKSPGKRMAKGVSTGDELSEFQDGHEHDGARVPSIAET